MRKIVCNQCGRDWPSHNEHMCPVSIQRSRPCVLEDHSEDLELIRADIRELRAQLAPFLAMGGGK